jgi:hypothetical protein
MQPVIRINDDDERLFRDALPTYLEDMEALKAMVAAPEINAQGAIAPNVASAGVSSSDCGADEGVSSSSKV